MNRLRQKRILSLSTLIIITVTASVSGWVFARDLGVVQIANRLAPSSAFIRALEARQQFDIVRSNLAAVNGDTGGLVWRTRAGTTSEPQIRLQFADYIKENNAMPGNWREFGPFFTIFTPLLIDVENNGFQIGDASQSVFFDYEGLGESVESRWVSIGTDDAFLVHDVNKNGYVDNGTELFGNATDLLIRNESSEAKAGDGYEALAQFDSVALGGNGDNKISRKDAIWSELSLWVDSNGDGVSVPDEVTPVSESILKVFRLKFKPVAAGEQTDDVGNYIPVQSWVKTKGRNGPKRVRMVDIYFAGLN